MNPCRFLFAPIAAAAALAAGLLPVAARAAWMGLADGDYAVLLQCDTSTEVPCPAIYNGSLTIAGGQAAAFDFSLDGLAFVGDPSDAVVDGSLVDTESSTLALNPFAFLSLRLITDGQIGPYGTGDHWWVYCNNVGVNCTPNTTGTWTAQALTAGRVPEPAPATLLAAAGLAMAWRRRSRRAAG